MRLTQAEPPVVEIRVQDRLGYVLEFRATKDPRPDHGYLVVGKVVHVLEALRQPVDSE
jgi:hypothetical protein